MAVTRINNNQITDASSGNAVLGVNAAVKLQNYTITSQKIANSLVYGSDLTVSGNLTVNGTTTTVDTVNTLIKDPIITLADGQTSGTPSVDIGVLGLRGSQNSSFIGWFEGSNTFGAVLSNTISSNTTVNVTSYGNFTASTITAQANLSVVGNIVGTANFSGNLTAGNILTPGLMSSTGNAILGNILTAGLISATSTITSSANITGGNILTAGLISSTGNLTAGNVSAVGVSQAASYSTTGNVTGGNILYGSGIVSGTGNIYGGNLIVTSIESVTGNVTGGNLLTAGLISATSTITSAANITGGNILTGGVVSATGNIFGGNLSVTGVTVDNGNITGGNLITGGIVSAAGNINSATNVNTPNVVATANLTLSTSGSGNINLSPTSGNVVLNSTYINGLNQPVQDNDAASKIYVDNRVSTQLSYHQAVTAATTTTLATATGGTITYTQPNGAANGIGALLTTTGSFNLIDTANVQTVGTRILVKNEGNAIFNGVYTWANATNIIRSTDTDQYGPNSVEELSVNDYFFVQSGNVNKGAAYICDAPNGTITFGTSNISFAQFSSSQTYTAGNGISLYGTIISTVYDNSTIGVNGSNQLYIPANAPLTTPNIGAATGTSLSVTGTVTATTLSATANVIGGNVSTTGLITATGNITGGNVLTAGLISSTGSITTASTLSATANITGGNILTAGLISSTGSITTASTVSATANITGGNILTAGLISATGNIYGGNLLVSSIESVAGNITAGNLLTGGLISATSTITSAANITGANILTGGLISATSTGSFGNITVGTNSINSANTQITFNSGSANTNFAFNGLSSNVFFINAAANTVSFGSNVQTTNAIASFNTTNAIKIPVGNTTQQPTGVTGMIRFNSSYNSVEVYNNTGWSNVGTQTFTVVTDEQFSNANGVTTNFTLTYGNQTTNTVIVSINGIVQIPTTAYAITGAGGNVLAFTEAPAVGDIIDVRGIATTTTVTGLQNGSTSISLDAASNISVTGNIVPNANVTYSLGNTTNRWANLWLSGTTIVLGNTTIKNTSGNSIGFFGPDGTTPATIDAASVDTTQIASGTSNVKVVSAGGNVTTNVGGTSNVMVVSSTGALINGDFSVTGNATLSGNILGDRIVNGTTELDIQVAGGDANLTVGGTANVVVWKTTGQFTTGLSSVTGNVIAGNVTTAGQVSAAGNITAGSGSYLLGNAYYVTGLSPTQIYSGTSNVTVTGSGANVAVSVGGTSNVVVWATTGQYVSGLSSVTGNVIGGNITTAGQLVSSIATGTAPLVITSTTVVPNLYVSRANVSDYDVVTTATTGTYYPAFFNAVTGNVQNYANSNINVNAATGALQATIISATANVIGGNITTVGLISATGGITSAATVQGLTVSATGNVIGGNVTTAGLISAAGGITSGTTVTAASVVGGVMTGSSLSVSGTVTGGSLTVGTGTVTVGNIVAGAGNLVGTIGTSSTWFGNAYVKAVNALYADLAENYQADAEYPAGTVVAFGGEAEVTASTSDADRRVAGVVSTNPSYVMNGGLAGTNVVTVALTGRVPTSVTGTVSKGDLMVSAGNGRARAETNPSVGTVIGKALENSNGDTVIEVVVGRF
jgi:filamentous hemagglutinin